MYLYSKYFKTHLKFQNILTVCIFSFCSVVRLSDLFSNKLTSLFVTSRSSTSVLPILNENELDVCLRY